MLVSHPQCDQTCQHATTVISSGSDKTEPHMTMLTNTLMTPEH